MSGHSAEAVAAFPDDATGPQHRLQLRAAFDQGVTRGRESRRAANRGKVLDCLFRLSTGGGPLSRRQITDIADAILAAGAFRDQREVQAEAWDAGAQSLQCHCHAWSEGECACGNYPGDPNPYRYRAGGVA